MFGLIRKKELKHLLDKLEVIEQNDCDGSHEETMWLNGSLEIIYFIAGYFGIELASMNVDKQDDNVPT